MHLKLVLIIVITLGFVGYKCSPLSASKYADKMTEQFSEHIQPGDERTKLLNYLQSNHINCRWDERERYLKCQTKGISSGTWLSHVVTLDIYLDEQNRFVRLAAQDKFGF